MPKSHGNSTYTKKIGKSICNLLAEGISMKAACKKVKVNYSTAHGWKENNEHFKELSACAREAGIDALGDECLDICDDGELDPQDKRVRIDTRLRLMGKWNPKKWGDKSQMDLNHGGKVTVESVTRTIIDPKNSE